MSPRWRGAGYDRVLVAHADLPLAVDIAWLARLGGLTLVPDRHDDGTNVVCLPSAIGFEFAYGPGSFRRHAAEGRRLGPGRPGGTGAVARLGRRRPRRPLPPFPPRGAAIAANEPGQPLLMPAGALTRNRAVPRSALAIGAHPDDVEFGAGGTLAKWAAAGCVVHHLVLTDGSKGTWDASADTVALVARRRDEQRGRGEGARRRPARSCSSATSTVSWRATWPDRAEVCRVLRELRPEVVLGHDPWKRYRLHPDHRHAGLLACEGIVAARDPHFFPEQGLAPHRPAALLLWEADEPDHAEDVSGFVAAKLAALEAHASQFESTMKATDELQLEAFRKRVRERLATHGRRIGAAAAELSGSCPTSDRTAARGRATPGQDARARIAGRLRTSSRQDVRRRTGRADGPGRAARRRPGRCPSTPRPRVPRRPARCRPGGVAA